MRAALLAAVVAVVTCCGLLGPKNVYWGRVPMEPPVEYRTWYGEVEACLGLTGNYGAISWFLADSITRGERRAAAATDLSRDEVTVTYRWVDVDWIVKHEAAHHVTGLGKSLHDNQGGVPCDGRP